MTTPEQALTAVVARRSRFAGGHDGAAAVLVGAAEAVAERLRRGATIVVAAGGCHRSDAEHVAVEFMHPVIVGMPAVPAVVVPQWPAGDQSVAALARPEDVVVSIGDVDVAAARRRGALTVALVSGEDRGLADHTVAVDTGDDWMAKEAFVTAYHVLWELTHLFLAGGEVAATDLGATAGLYPFLAGTAGPPAFDDAVRSTRAKLAEIESLRSDSLRRDARALAACAAAVAARVEAGGRVLAFGNGGSSTDAASLAAALGAPGEGRVPAWSLADDRATVTALANDVGFEVVFSRQVDAVASSTDVCVGLSTSGSSGNVVRGLEQAARRGALTVAFAGYDGGAMAGSGDIDHLFVVPSTSVHRIQEVQSTLYLTLAAVIRFLAGDHGQPPPPPDRG